ncbi:MAG: DMT family transporter [Pseudorhodobacter sp.]|nr:DMT family transporter [Pseudorhodobacter sp.]
MRYRTGVALVFAAGVLWSFQGLVIRNIHEAGPWAVLFWRSAGMIPVLALWILWQTRGRLLASLRGAGLPGVLGGLSLVLAFGGAIYALQTTTVANAVLLFAASPIFAAILGRLLLHEAVTPLTWASILLALVGVGVMVGGGFQGGGLLGNLAALLSALGFAIFTVTLRWGHSTAMLQAVLLGALFSLAAGAVAALVLGQTLLVPVQDAGLAAMMGAVTLTGGMVLYTVGSRVVPAAQATLISLAEVLLAPLWAWLFLAETLSQNTILGGSVLLAAVILNALGQTRPSTLTVAP